MDAPPPFFFLLGGGGQYCDELQGMCGRGFGTCQCPLLRARNVPF